MGVLKAAEAPPSRAQASLLSVLLSVPHPKDLKPPPNYLQKVPIPVRRAHPVLNQMQNRINALTFKPPWLEDSWTVSAHSHESPSVPVTRKAGSTPSRNPTPAALGSCAFGLHDSRTLNNHVRLRFCDKFMDLLEGRKHVPIKHGGNYQRMF